MLSTFKVVGLAGVPVVVGQWPTGGRPDPESFVTFVRSRSPVVGGQIG